MMKTAGCSKNVRVEYIDVQVVVYLDADNVLVPWSGDPATLQTVDQCASHSE